MPVEQTRNRRVSQAGLEKNLGFLEKVFRFFKGFLDFSVQRQPDKKLRSRKNILDPVLEQV